MLMQQPNRVIQEPSWEAKCTVALPVVAAASVNMLSVLKARGLTNLDFWADQPQRRLLLAE